MIKTNLPNLKLNLKKVNLKDDISFKGTLMQIAKFPYMLLFR